MGHAVEHRLQRHVGRGPHEVDNGAADGPEGRDASLSLGRVTGPDRDDGQRRLTVLFRGQDRQRRRLERGHRNPQLVRRLGSKVTHETQDRWRILDGPEDGTAEHESAHRTELVFEGGSDAEVAATAAQTPEEVRLRLGVDVHLFAIGRDQIDRKQVVDRQAVLAHQVPEPAAKRQSGDAGVADDSARRGQGVLLGGAIELAPEHAARGTHRTRVRVELDGLHEREIDHDAVVADGVSGDGMSSPANGNQLFVRAGELDGRMTSSAPAQRAISAG